MRSDAAVTRARLRSDPSWVGRVGAASGEAVGLCYGCGVCSGGCPLASHMDLLPSRLMKAVQLGLRDRVLSAASPWLCVACQTCAVRCPNGIDLSRVMDAVRHEAIGDGREGARPEIHSFHRWFLRTVRLFGRAHEGLLSAGFSLQAGQLRRDLPTGLALMRRRRLALLPHRVRRIREVRRLFGRAGRGLP